MRPAQGQKKFQLDPPYAHLRSDGLTSRRNGGAYLQPEGEPDE